MMKLIFILCLLALAACDTMPRPEGWQVIDIGSADDDLLPSVEIDLSGDDVGIEIDLEETIEFPPVLVNGTRVSGSTIAVVGNYAIFPTHVSLEPVARALNEFVYWDHEIDEVGVHGLNGNILFVIGSHEFIVGTQTISLAETSVVIDGRIYVPINFFTLVWGMGSSFFRGGDVIISTVVIDTE